MADSSKRPARIEPLKLPRLHARHGLLYFEYQPIWVLILVAVLGLGWWAFGSKK